MQRHRRGGGEVRERERERETITNTKHKKSTAYHLKTCKQSTKARKTHHSPKNVRKSVQVSNFTDQNTLKKDVDFEVWSSLSFSFPALSDTVAHKRCGPSPMDPLIALP
jgi:hypothetical protein